MPRRRSEAAKRNPNIPANRRADPTPEEIREITRQIQSEWTPELERERTPECYRNPPASVTHAKAPGWFTSSNKSGHLNRKLQNEDNSEAHKRQS